MTPSEKRLAALYVVIVLWTITFVICAASCLVSCILGPCCPHRLKRVLAVVAGVFVFATIIVTAAFTNTLHALWSGTESVVVGSLKLAQHAL